MKILLPVHAFSDRPRSGLHAAVWNIARCLGDMGHEVHVVSTFTDLKEETVASLRNRNIRLHRAGQFNAHNLGPAHALRCFVTALRLRLTNRFDWIFVIDTSVTPFHRFKLGAKLATRVLAPESLDLQGLFTSGSWQYDRERKDKEERWDGRRKPLWFRAFSLLALAWYRLFPVKRHTDNADLVFCQNRTVLAEWEGRTGVTCAYLPNGVETAPLEKTGPAPVKTDRFPFLYVGRVAKRYGLFELLPVFEQLRKERDDVELWVLGKGSDELTAELQAYVDRDPERIRAFGEIPKEDIGPFYHACGALVNPAYYHGFPASVLEAMYCGKPVLAPEKGGSRDMVEEGVEGFLIDPEKPEELLARMRTLAADRTAAREMGEAGRRRIENGFLWEQVAATMEQAFLKNA